METVPPKVLMTCKKCSNPLNMNMDLDLMVPPSDDDTVNSISDIIIPVSQTHELHSVIEVGPDVSCMGTVSDFSTQFKVANEIFTYMSGRSVIDHPMCQDCANIVIAKQEMELKQSEEENEILEKYLKILEDNPLSTEVNYDSELHRLDDENAALQAELASLLLENESLDSEIEQEKENLRGAELEYDRVVMDYNNKKQQLFDLEDDIRSLSQRKKYLSFLADRLKRTNLLNLLFPIWYDGHFGTINGLRMGRLQEVNVERSEINAGWGQCVLLMQNILRKMEMSLENYKLNPCGSSSWIESLADKKKHLLFQTSAWRISTTKFDQAMAVYLECLNQIINRIETYDQSFKFPYQIVEKHKLEDSDGQKFSIKLSGNTDENWTKALKFMLINLKWIMTWMVKSSFKQYCDSFHRKQLEMPLSTG